MLRVLVCLCLIGASTLSWTSKTFRANSVPGSDLKRINREQCTALSRVWYEHVFDRLYEDIDVEDEDSVHKITRALQRALHAKDRFDNDFTIQHINLLESALQRPNSHAFSYLAWMPRETETNACEDLLALVVCDREHASETPRLLSIVCNPEYVWSEHIALRELKRALLHHAVNVTAFASRAENKRVVLEWSW